MRFSSSFLFLILIFFLGSCSSEPVVVQKPPPVVTAMVVKPIDIPAVFTFVGRSESSHSVEIRSRVEGYLQEISYTEGQLVQEGTLLFKLDPKPLEASLKNVEAQLSKQEAILARAQMEVTRLTPLYEKKATSKKSLDDAESSLLTSKANVEAAKAEVEQAKLNLGYTTIYSPIKGLTGSSLYRVGALITPGAGSLMTTVSQINPIWINFSVSEGQTLLYEQQVKNKVLIIPETENYKVQVILGDGSTYPYEGYVDFASPTIETNTGTISLRAVVPNPDGMIKPGQFVRVRLLGATRPNSIIIPQQAVSQGNQGFYVYTLNQDDIVEMKPVEVSQWFKDYWIITSGLNKEDRIIVDGINKVITGSPVKISSYIDLPEDFTQKLEKTKNQ